MTSFVVSVWLTTVANVMIVYATVPFLAAASVSCGTASGPAAAMLVAAAVAFLGVAIMAGAAASLDDLIGCAVALLMTATFATQLVMARRYPTLEMAPVNGAGAALCAVLFFPFASAQIPDPQQLGILWHSGSRPPPVPMSCSWSAGATFRPARRGCIGMLDVVLAPLWVWLLFNEQPGSAALIGGVIVLAAVLWYLGAELRAASPSAGRV
jgi:drug/metabolite transporter (DMT)-like permease